MKKIISIFISLVLAFQLIMINVQTIHAYNNSSYDDGYKLPISGASCYNGNSESLKQWGVIKSVLPVLINSPTITNSKGTFGFNFTLWEAKHIAVYGDYKSGGLNPRQQSTGGMVDFKTDVEFDCGTYYKNSNSNKGQYRYHGFDEVGNPYSNTDFPPDTPTILINSYKWLYQPWGDPTYKGNQSIWNKSAENYLSGITTPENQKMFEMISHLYKDEADQSIPFSTKTDLNFKNTTNPSKNACDYANVMSAPTTVYPGEAKLWHMPRPGVYYYRTTFVPPVKKLHTLVALTGSIVSPDLSRIKDYGAKNTQEYLDSNIELKIQVKATLQDEAYYNNEVMSVAYYTRADIKSGTDGWTLGLTTSSEGTKNISTAKNLGITTFKKIIKTRDIINLVRGGVKKFQLPVSAKVNYLNNEFDTADEKVDIPFDIAIIQEPLQEEEQPEGITFIPSVILPKPAFDIVPYKPTDNSDLKDVEKKEVFIDGSQLDYDTFFSGSYTFGATGRDEIRNVVIKYTLKDGTIAGVSKWILVYNTKPRVQFNVVSDYRQYRLFKVTNTSSIANVPEVLAAYPIVKYQWVYGAVEGDISSMKLRDISDLYKEFMYKAPGTYSITLVGTNTLGRSSDPYVLQFEVMPDIAPAVICELDNVVIARDEKLGAYIFEAVSTDGDQINSNTIDLYYDSNNDGTPETLLQTWNKVQTGEFPQYTPTKLGMYRWRITSQEKLAGETMPEYMTEEDIITKALTKDFWVDNYLPQTDMYIDTPNIRAVDDVFIMMDKDLDSSKVTYIKNSRIDFNNYMRSYYIDPVVENWDMHTYIYSQPANTTSNTGTSSPPGTVDYLSNGYSGTLSRTSVSDNGSNVDKGSWQTRVESSTQTKSASAGGQSVSGHGASTTFPPSSVSYSDGDGYSGTLSAYGYSYSSVGTADGSYDWTRSYSGYSGTVSRTVSTTVTYWQSNWVWVANYTGFYSGTIYKSVRQPYADPFRPISDKYVIYVSDGNIGELNDLKDVIRKSGAKLILIGQNSIKTQIAYDTFFLNNKPIESVMQEALDYISNKNTIPEQYTILKGDTFTLNTLNYDQDGDVIVEERYQYVQNQCYDNPTGNEPLSVSTYSSAAGWVSNKLNTFNNVGSFDIYRQIRDLPSNDPNFAQYSYLSNLPVVRVNVVRKPIALATLDWDFDSTAANYKTTWVDKSYSLEHQFSRPDKGILSHKIMFRQSGGEWQYVIPAILVPGTYELNYYVQSIEGYWSDPFVMNFTLDAAPPIQLNASLKTENSLFSTASIPASENLQVYNLWTRYPYEVSLTVRLYNSTGTVEVATQKDITFSASTGTKTGNDINWNDIIYTIPATLADGKYILRVTANGKYGQTKYIDFPVTVSTPINLKGYINGNLKDAELYTDENNNFTFSTSVYVTKVQLSFKGVTYTSTAGQIPLRSQDSTTKIWEMTKFIADGTMPDEETGNGVFIATLPSGASQTVNVNYKVIALRLKNLRISKIYDFSWKDLFVKPNGLPTALQLGGIQTKDMPVYKNLSNKYIKLGYKVSFKIDSMGLYRPGEEITVKVKYLSLDNKLKYQPVDIFFRKEDGQYDRLGEKPDIYNLESFTLNERKRFKYEPDPSKNTYNTWDFDFYLPATIKIVRKAEGLDLFNDNTLKTKLLVLFDITCKKQGASTIYDYSAKETAWGTDVGGNYGKNYPTKEKILGKGINAGEVFWYDLNETALNDVDVDRQW